MLYIYLFIFTSPTIRDLHWDNWQSPSYLYFGLIGTVTAVIVGLAVSLLTGKPVDFVNVTQNTTNIFYIKYFDDIVLFISGGWKSRAESAVTLMKEDTTFYHMYMFVKNRVSAAGSKQYERLQTGNSC